MTSIEIQDHLNVYSIFSFRDGRKEPGLLINRYNLQLSQVEYYFIRQENMQAYKSAFERYDRDTCARLIEKLEPADVASIRPVSLSDYKIIMQLLHERQELMQQR